MGIESPYTSKIGPVKSNTTVTTAPAYEPVTMAEAKAHCRVYHALDNTYFGGDVVGAGIIAAARQTVENLISRPIVTTGFTTVFNGFPGSAELALPMAPLVAVSSLTYVDSSLSTITMNSSTDYLLKSYNGMGGIYMRTQQAWPTTYDGPEGVVTAVYTAGYGSTQAAIPMALRQAVLLQVQGLYEQRSPIAPNQMYEVPRVVLDLVSQFISGEYR